MYLNDPKIMGRYFKFMKTVYDIEKHSLSLSFSLSPSLSLSLSTIYLSIYAKQRVKKEKKLFKSGELC